VTVAVTDDEPGVPSEDLPHRFERFWRGGARPAAGHRRQRVGPDHSPQPDWGARRVLMGRECGGRGKHVRFCASCVSRSI